MEATHKFVCQDDLVNPLSSMGMQVACILVISHFFHILLKALGQPGPIAQILVSISFWLKQNKFVNMNFSNLWYKLIVS